MGLAKAFHLEMLRDLSRGIAWFLGINFSKHRVQASPLARLRDPLHPLLKVRTKKARGYGKIKFVFNYRNILTRKIVVAQP